MGLTYLQGARGQLEAEQRYGEMPLLLKDRGAQRRFGNEEKGAIGSQMEGKR